MNTNDYAQLAKHTASWAQGIRNGQAVLVAESLERVSAYCLEQASVPDEYMRESFKCPCVNAVEVKWWKLLSLAPIRRLLQVFWSREKRKTTA